MKTTTTFPLVPETSFSHCTSSSKQELAQLLERFHGSKHLLQLLHFIDSGGQPQLHEVFPTFTGNTMDIIMKLSEGWDKDLVVNIIIKVEICVANLSIMEPAY